MNPQLRAIRSIRFFIRTPEFFLAYNRDFVTIHLYMERTLHPPVLKSYLMLTKPGIILGNALTAATGFVLTAAPFNLSLFLAMLGGLASIIGASCIVNNYIDRMADAKMHRTRFRALARGIVPPQSALLFACCLMMLGAFILAFCTNLLALIVALLGVFVYVVPYSFLKYRTPHVTLIGSIAGAAPPVVGYTSMTGALDSASMILFLTIVLWQMPHFYAIAVYRMQEYAAAGIPVLPLKKGLRATKMQMLYYIVAFTLVASLLTFFDYTSSAFLLIMLICSAGWFLLALKGFNTSNDSRWARQMFIFSLIVINLFCLTILFSRHTM